MKHFKTIEKIATDILYSLELASSVSVLFFNAAQQVEQELRGFTIAYAELCNSGYSRLADGSVHHVFVPQQQSYSILKPEVYNGATVPNSYAQ